MVKGFLELVQFYILFRTFLQGSWSIFFGVAGQEGGLCSESIHNCLKTIFAETADQP